MSLASPIESEPPPTPLDGSSSAAVADDCRFTYPFSNAKGLLVVIPDDKIDVEAEARFYDDFCDDDDVYRRRRRSRSAPSSPRGPPSVFSHDIWLGDNSGESHAFARDVTITGWTNVGDRLGGAYVVYDCAVRTSQNTVIHTHKRYSAFVQLQLALKHTLPRAQRHDVPPLPPKAPLAKYRPTFLDKRRRMLQHWLSAVLLHPDIGGNVVVREWIMD